MKLVAICPVRNEEWVLGLSLRAALDWCDEVVVGLHACTDASAAIVDQVAAEQPGRVITQVFDGTIWTEMEHRHVLLSRARARDASHIAIVDADEVLTANLLPTIRDHVQHIPAGHILQLPGYNLRRGLWRYHANGIWANRTFSVAFADSAELHWTGDRFHHREPMGRKLTPWRLVPHGKGGILHLWGACENRLRAKHALYKLTERKRWPGKPVADIDRLYSLAVHGEPSMPAQYWHYAAVPLSWWGQYTERLAGLLDGEPWQVEECCRILEAEPGLATGLDLFGIVG